MKKTYKVSGMMCCHCEAAVSKALEAIPEVESASADYSAGKVEVVFKDGFDENVIVKTIENAGYKVG